MIFTAKNAANIVFAMNKFCIHDKKYKTPSINDRQRKMLNKLFNGFKGKLFTSKWAKMCKCSKDTALRDIQDLVKKGMLQKDEGGGRNTSYSLRLD